VSNVKCDDTPDRNFEARDTHLTSHLAVIHARTRNLSVCSGMNAFGARKASADMARLESRVAAPLFLNNNMPRELSGTRSRQSPAP
jgi:hypothetical protein